MNAARRKQLAAVLPLIEQMDALREEIREALENVRDEEQEYFDNMPESLQGGDKGHIAESAISNLENAISALEDFDPLAVSGAVEEASA